MLEQISQKYKELKSGFIFNKQEIESNLLPNQTTIDSLTIGKNYFTEDFDGSYCSYYLIQKQKEDILSLIPLWFNTDGFYATSAETDNDIANIFTIRIASDNEKEIIYEISDFQVKEKGKYNLTDYWLIAADTWHMNTDNQELLEKTFRYNHL